jgi:hypothetical protein
MTGPRRSLELDDNVMPVYLVLAARAGDKVQLVLVRLGRDGHADFLITALAVVGQGALNDLFGRDAALELLAQQRCLLRNFSRSSGRSSRSSPPMVV